VQYQVVVVVMVLAVVLVMIGRGRGRGRGRRDHQVEVTGGVVQRGVTGRRGAGRGRAAALGGRGRQGLLLVVVIPVVRRVLLLYDVLLL